MNCRHVLVFLLFCRVDHHQADRGVVSSNCSNIDLLTDVAGRKEKTRESRWKRDKKCKLTECHD